MNSDDHVKNILSICNQLCYFFYLRKCLKRLKIKASLLRSLILFLCSYCVLHPLHLTILGWFSYCWFDCYKQCILRLRTDKTCLWSLVRSSQETVQQNAIRWPLYSSAITPPPRSLFLWRCDLLNLNMYLICHIVIIICID